MEKKMEIKEIRTRLDRTLALPDLVNPKAIRSLVRNQLTRSDLEGNIDVIVDKHTNEVSNFLEMLRSASENEGVPNDWKVKQDTDQLRVLYREGPHGTPFHTLLMEGFGDGPIDVCLCVSWESTLYKKWWPQYNFPSFQIIASDLLKRIRVGEDISLIRVKVPWPVSDREVLLHYFEIEFIQEDLVIVLLNSISDEENIDINSHGFTKDGIPKANGTVRMDLIGGIVLQKVNDNKSYFRAIANMDVKLDFVPPALINFVARQLIGNGHKLYQKAVRTVATSDEDYKKALKNALYVQIRNSMNTIKNPEISQYSNSTSTNDKSISEIQELEDDEEEEWYDAPDEIYNDDQMKNDTNSVDEMKNDTNSANQMKNDKNSTDGLHAFERKFDTVLTASNFSLCDNGDINMKSNLLNASHQGDTSSKNSRQNGSRPCTFTKEKNRKVVDEGNMKNNGFNVKLKTDIHDLEDENVNNKNSNKKRTNKNKKWNCCLGTSAVKD